jgi:hypothetical protein
MSILDGISGVSTTAQIYQSSTASGTSTSNGNGISSKAFSELLAAMVTKADSDNSGTVSSTELSTLLGCTDDQAEKLIAALDKDKSGELSENEFAALFQPPPPPMMGMLPPPSTDILTAQGITGISSTDALTGATTAVQITA